MKTQTQAGTGTDTGISADTDTDTDTDIGVDKKIISVCQFYGLKLYCREYGLVNRRRGGLMLSPVTASRKTSEFNNAGTADIV